MASINPHDAKNLPFFIKKIRELNQTVSHQLQTIETRDKKIEHLKNEHPKRKKQRAGNW